MQSLKQKQQFLSHQVVEQNKKQRNDKNESTEQQSILFADDFRARSPCDRCLSIVE